MENKTQLTEKEQAIKDLDHLLLAGHGELVIQVTDHKIVDIKCDIHRIMSKKDNRLNS